MNRALVAMAALATLSAAADAAAPGPAADVHCHFTTPGYLALLERHGALMDELYPIPAWSPEALAAFLDEAGIGLAVLTSVAPQPHFGDAAESAAACRELNDEAARLAAADPARLKWCATLPLPSVTEAVEEAERALDELGAAGVKLPTNARGLYLGDEALDPLMAALDARSAVAILHPHRPEPFDAKLADGLPLAMYEYPAETTRALARLFARNVPARYPNVKFVVPHAGAFLPLALPRMRAVHKIVRAKGYAGDIDWDANLRSLWFDLAGAPTAESVRRLLALTTPDRILYGSDFPYAPAPALAAALGTLRKQLAADPELAPHAEAILGGNARRLFESHAESAEFAEPGSAGESRATPAKEEDTSRTSRTPREANPSVKDDSRAQSATPAKEEDTSRTSRTPREANPSVKDDSGAHSATPANEEDTSRTSRTPREANLSVKDDSRAQSATPANEEDTSRTSRTSREANPSAKDDSGAQSATSAKEEDTSRTSRTSREANPSVKDDSGAQSATPAKEEDTSRTSRTPREANPSAEGAAAIPPRAIFRIAEIEVKPEYLDAYLAAAGDVGATSVREEPGVLCIFPMQDVEKPTSIRIVEIYRDEAAYKSHLATPHFLRYKTGTPHMIESLRLAPMRPLDPTIFPDVFRKVPPPAPPIHSNPTTP